jgi:hypothetical protein
VSAWVTKTCFALSYAMHQAPPRIPASHRKETADLLGKQPPSDVGVLLGSDDSSTNQSREVLNLASFSSSEYTVRPPGASRRFVAYALFLRIHRLVGIVIGVVQLPKQYGPVPHTLEGRQLQRLWPMVEEVI